MFIGTDEKLKKKIQEFNTNSDWFIFSQGDLEPIYKEISGKKYSIVSSELKQKLGEIISQRKRAGDNISSSPTIIEAQLSLDPNKSEQSFGPANYGWWFSVKKEHIYQQARNSGGKLIKLTLDNQKGNWINTTTESLGYIFGDESYRLSSEWKEVWQNEKQSVEEKYNSFRNFCRTSRQEIKDKIKEANMEIAEIFADWEEYFGLQPDYCFCGDSPEEKEEYYWDHITYCLDREEKIIEFKDKIMKIVERSVRFFNQRRKEIIEKAKQEAQNKGVQLEFDFWEKAVYECWNSEQLNRCEKQTNDLIQALANISEEARKEREKIAREAAQEKQEEAKKEREEQKKKKDNKNKKTHKEEKLREEWEEKAKEAENRFSNQRKDFGLSQEQEEINKKVADLQNKLREQEKLEDADNPSREDEKRKLEKELWDLKMNDLANNPPVPPSKRNNNPQDDPKNQTSSHEWKKSNFEWANTFFFSVIFVIGMIIIIFLVIKKRKN